MDDIAFGRVFRTVRQRRRLRQRDVAAAAGVSDVLVSRIERGQASRVALHTIRRIVGVLEIEVSLVARWRGGELERLQARRHSALAEAVIARLSAFGWEVRPEVSFSIFGERGVIDVLAWHPATQTLLVIELKTEIVNVGELLGALDRKARLAPRISADLAWRPATLALALIVADSSTNRRHVRAHARTLRAMLPADGRRLRGWLAKPTDEVRALAFWSDLPGMTTTKPVRRVRAPAAACRVHPGAAASVGNACQVSRRR
jgi:transcriptional regulator with XRE-family HTH domain